MGPVTPAGPVGPMGPVAPSAPVGPVAPSAPAGPVGPVAPVGPTNPVEGPVHVPVESITVTPFTTTLVGVMSPTALLAMSAYGTLTSDCRGVISASDPTFTPR